MNLKWKISKNQNLKISNSYKKPAVMGILNTTPDSFSDGKLYQNPDSAYSHYSKLCSDGAKIIDIGGESTRPNSKPITVKEELKRVNPIFEKINANKNKAILSIDTYKAEVAENCLKNGAKIVNDISALSDPKMPDLIKQYQCGLVLMHMQGRPISMQEKPKYKNVIDEIITFFEKKIKFAQKYGIDEKQIAIDPGIGFGKTLTHNLQILANLKKFQKFKAPIVLGISKKSFIAQLLKLNPKDIKARNLPTHIISTLCSINTKNIIWRTHDVKNTIISLKTMAYFLECPNKVDMIF